MRALAAGLLTLASWAQAQVAPPATPEPGRVYAPGAFERIELNGSARVLLVQGERDQVFIAGDDEVQKQVSVELVDRRLVVHPVGGWKFWNATRLNIQIEMRQISHVGLSGATELHAPGAINVEALRLSISGAGQARFDRLRADKLGFHISGAGDGQLAGEVRDLSLHISGKGKVLADQLKAQRAQVSISGIGSASVWVTEDLAAHISGVGSVDYFGSPQVRRSVSGMGSINAKGERR